MNLVDAGTTIYDDMVFVDGTGTLVDPDFIRAYVMNPDSSIDTYAFSDDSPISRLSAGRYRMQLVIPVPGEHVIRWEGTYVSGPSIASQHRYVGRDTLYELPRPATVIPTPAEFTWSPITEWPCPMAVQLDAGFTPSKFKNTATTKVFAAVRQRTVGPSNLGLKALLGWWDVSGSDDEGSGALGEAMLPNGGRVNVWAKYADGTYDQLKFRGVEGYTFNPDEPMRADEIAILRARRYPESWIADLKNVLVLSDSTGVPVAAAQTFHSVTQITVNNALNLIPGGQRLLSLAGTDGFTGLGEFAAGGDYDPTASYTFSGELNAYGPLCWCGYGNHPTAAIGGTSHSAGTDDAGIRDGNNGAPYRGLSGQIENGLNLNLRSTVGLGPMLPKGGEESRQARNKDTYKYRLAAAVLSGTRNITFDVGANDINAVPTRTIQEIKDDILAVAQLFVTCGIRFIAIAPPPKTSSTDDFLTVANQARATDYARRNEIRAWVVGGGFKADAVALGMDPDLLEQNNIYGGVSCLYGGTPDPLGEYWLPDQGPPLGYASWKINQTNQASIATFRDSVNFVAPLMVRNQYRGYTVSVDGRTGPGTAPPTGRLVITSNIGTHRSIRYINIGNGTLGSTAFAAFDSDTYGRYDPATAESEYGTITARTTKSGIHTCGPGAKLAALEVNVNLLVGFPKDVSGSALPQWELSEQDIIYQFNTQNPVGCYQDSTLTTLNGEDTDGAPVGALRDLQGVWNAHAIQATAGNQPVWKWDHYENKPYVYFPGTDEFLRRSASTTQVNGAQSATTILVDDSTVFNVGDGVYFATALTARTVTGKPDSTHITISGTALSVADNEVIRRTIIQLATVLMVMQHGRYAASSGSGDTVFSGAHTAPERIQFAHSTVPAAGTARNLTASTNVSWGDIDLTKPHLYVINLNTNDSSFYVDGVLETPSSPNIGANPWSGLTLGANQQSSPAAFSEFYLGQFAVIRGNMSAYDVSRAWETYFQPLWGL